MEEVYLEHQISSAENYYDDESRRTCSYISDSYSEY
jgi:hypothetical protein